MKVKDRKVVEKLVDKVMQDAQLKSPSFNFTSKVMSHIDACQSNKVIAYKPLISKRIWGVIGFSILVICIYLYINIPSNETSWLSNIDFNVINNDSITQSVSGFKISKTLMYSIVFLSIMICVQIPLLKNHFNKRFES